MFREHQQSAQPHPTVSPRVCMTVMHAHTWHTHAQALPDCIQLQWRQGLDSSASLVEGSSLSGAAKQQPNCRCHNRYIATTHTTARLPGISYAHDTQAAQHTPSTQPLAGCMHAVNADSDACSIHTSAGPDLGAIHSFVFTHPDDFPEVTEFIRTADQQ